MTLRTYRRWNKELIIKELMNVRERLRHSPSSREVKGSFIQVCSIYFGSFNKAKKAAGLEINKIKYNKVKKSAYRLTEDLAYILGVVEGDGNVFVKMSSHGTIAKITLKVKDLDFALHFKKILEKWSGIKSSLYNLERINQIAVNLYSIEVAKIIKNFKIKDIIKSNRNIKYKFLKGLFDSDGGVFTKNLDNRRYSKRWVHFSNSNKEIIDIVCSLLNEMKINYKVNSRVHSGFGSKKTQYEIKIYDKNSIYLFYKNINFNIKRKRERLKELLKSYTTYSEELFNNAKLLHNDTGYKKAAKQLNLNDGVVYD